MGVMRYSNKCYTSWGSEIAYWNRYNRMLTNSVNIITCIVLDEGSFVGKRKRKLRLAEINTDKVKFWNCYGYNKLQGTIQKAYFVKTCPKMTAVLTFEKIPNWLMFYVLQFHFNNTCKKLTCHCWSVLLSFVTCLWKGCFTICLLPLFLCLQLLMQVLDFTVFPKAEYDIPIFCANFFTSAKTNIVVL